MEYLNPYLAEASTAATGIQTWTSTAMAPLCTMWEISTASPLALSFMVCFIGMFSCYIGNVASGYWSWVDRCWSTFPVVYAFIYAFSGVRDARVSLMAFLVLVWGGRLTFNFWRKGGYAELEDYRWEVLRASLKKMDKFHPLLQEIFNISFVCFFQMFLIYMFVAPVMDFAWNQANTIDPITSASLSPPLGWKDAVLTILFLVFVAGETWTDQTQWEFQSAKYAMTVTERIKAGGDFARGFCTTGPFKYSRHMNFFCEMSIWWTFYGFTWAAGNTSLINYACAGAFVLTGLFQGSTNMTEDLSVGKYPAYKEYMKTTSRLIPMWAGPSLDASSTATSKASNDKSAPKIAASSPSPTAAAAPKSTASKASRRGSRAAL